MTITLSLLVLAVLGLLVYALSTNGKAAGDRPDHLLLRAVGPLLRGLAARRYPSRQQMICTNLQ